MTTEKGLELTLDAVKALAAIALKELKDIAGGLTKKCPPKRALWERGARLTKRAPC